MHILKFLLAASLVSSFLACGGGGESTPQQGTPQQPTTATVQPRVDAALAGPAAITVQTVSTIYGSAPIGQSVAAPYSSGSAQGVVLASDAQGRPVLAAMASGGELVLSARSTVLALVKILMAQSISGGQLTDFDTRVQRLEAFASAEQAFAAAYMSGAVPMESLAFRATLSALVTAAYGEFSSNVFQGRASPLAVSSSRVSSPWHVHSVSLGGAALPIVLRSANANELVFLNRTPLTWDLAITPEPTTNPGVAPVSIEIGGASALSLAAERLLPESLRPDDLLAIARPRKPGAGAFDVRVQLNTRSSQRELAEKVIASILAVAGARGLTNCVSDIVTGNVIGNLFIVDRTFTSELGLSESMRASLLTQISVLESCFEGTTAATASLNFAVNILTTVLAADDIVTVAPLAWLLYRERNSMPVTVGVCVDEAQTPMSCVHRLRFDPIEPKPMVVGASQLLRVEATGADGQLVVYPYGLQVERLGSSVSFAPSNMTLSAEANGQTLLEVRDPATDARDVIIASVATPSLAPASTLTRPLGSPVEFRLVDSVGRPMISQGASVRWEIEDPTKAQIVSALFSEDGVQTVRVQALGWGRTRLLAHIPTVQTPISAEIEATENIPGQIDFVWQNIYCDSTVSVALDVTDDQGQSVFTASGSHTNSTCHPGNLGEPNAYMGFSTTLARGRTYTARLSWTKQAGQYELTGEFFQYAIGTPLPISVSGPPSPITPGGAVEQTFTVR